MHKALINKIKTQNIHVVIVYACVGGVGRDDEICGLLTIICIVHLDITK